MNDFRKNLPNCVFVETWIPNPKVKSNSHVNTHLIEIF